MLRAGPMKRDPSTPERSMRRSSSSTESNASASRPRYASASVRDQRAWSGANGCGPGGLRNACSTWASASAGRPAWSNALAYQTSATCRVSGDLLRLRRTGRAHQRDRRPRDAPAPTTRGNRRWPRCRRQPRAPPRRTRQRRRSRAGSTRPSRPSRAPPRRRRPRAPSPRRHSHRRDRVRDMRMRALATNVAGSASRANASDSRLSAVSTS